MAGETVRPGVDATWLERAARASPLEHAYALWDLVQAPDRTRFYSIVRGATTRAYLLLWHGNPAAAVAHWVGDADPALLPWLPLPPCVLLVPVAAAPLVTAARPGLVGSSTSMMMRDPDRPLPSETRGVRRLTGRDRGLLPHVLDSDSPMYQGYLHLDPAIEPVWGAFDGDRLVGVAHVPVSLPFVWVIAGVYTRPEARGKGIAQAVTAAVCRHAEHAGATAGLFVRDENAPARRVYEKLGFRTVGHKVWFEVAAPAVA
jgi:GNAT superfamily N-acetyltransferase